MACGRGPASSATSRPCAHKPGTRAPSVIARKVRVPRRGVSLEAAARAERYRALVRVAREVGAPVIITGHHRDDVVETMLLALVRGSGLDGLAAMRAQRQLAPGIALLRPLLQYGKAQLREFVRASGVAVAGDETNADLRLRRNAGARARARARACGARR